jgi:hypothetical protein
MCPHLGVKAFHQQRNERLINAIGFGLTAIILSVNFNKTFGHSALF